MVAAPFHVVHFDGRGFIPGAGSGAVVAAKAMMTRSGEGIQAFEQVGGDPVTRSGTEGSRGAGPDGRAPVVMLNACQSGEYPCRMRAQILDGHGVCAGQASSRKGLENR